MQMKFISFYWEHFSTKQFFTFTHTYSNTHVSNAYTHVVYKQRSQWETEQHFTKNRWWSPRIAHWLSHILHSNTPFHFVNITKRKKLNERMKITHTPLFLGQHFNEWRGIFTPSRIFALLVLRGAVNLFA